MLLFSICCCVATALAASPLLFSVDTTPESYWSATLTETSLYGGTLGLLDCRTDAVDFRAGQIVSSTPNVCRVAANGENAFAAVGYNDPNLTWVVNASTDVHWSGQIGGEYYFAYNVPVIVRPVQNIY